MAIDLGKLEDAPHLLDLLIQMEDVLDSLDIYVFENWFEGEVVEGPKVRRYWLDMTLLFPACKMPDPRAGLRLLKHGVRVDFQKAAMQQAIERRSMSSIDAPTAEGDGKEAADAVWLVRISIPRRLIAEINAGELDFYDDEVDAEDIQDAQDSGMNEDSAVSDPDNGLAADGANGADATADDPAAQGPGGPANA